MVTALPASINPKERTTRCLRNFDSEESSLGHTCFAKVFVILMADFFSSTIDMGVVVVAVSNVAGSLLFLLLSVLSIPLLSISEAFELIHRYVVFGDFDFDADEKLHERLEIVARFKCCRKQYEVVKGFVICKNEELRILGNRKTVMIGMLRRRIERQK